MAAHLRPRVQAITDRRARSGLIQLKRAADKCSGVLGGGRAGVADLKDFVYEVETLPER